MADDWTRDDGRFRVTVRPRSGDRWLVRAWFRGDTSPPSETHRHLEAAVVAAETIWRAYLSGQIERPEALPETLGELRVRVEARTDIRPATRRDYDQVLASLERAVGADRALAQLHARDLRLWLAALTCGDVTRQTYLRTIGVVCRWARKQGWTSHDPTDGVQVAAASPEMRPWLRPAEWPAFLAACPPALRIRAAFVLETGLRLGELVHARWTWVHSVVGTPAIRIPEDVAKAGRARAVPLSRVARDVLVEARGQWGGGDFIFGGHRLSATGNLARRVRDACAKAGVTLTDFHGLRRSAGAAWLEGGASIYEVSRLLGHRSVTTTERSYAGIADAHLAAVIARVDESRAAAAQVVPIRRGKRQRD